MEISRALRRMPMGGRLWIRSSITVRVIDGSAMENIVLLLYWSYVWVTSGGYLVLPRSTARTLARDDNALNEQLAAPDAPRLAPIEGAG
jgi:hypothetical protein